MKKLLLAALAAITFASLAADVDAPVLTVRRKVPLTWCSLGTSISWYNNHVAPSFTKGYQTRVMEQIKFSGFINKGVNGGCVNTAINSVVPADFYTIEHGINDWGNRVKPGTLADYENNTGNNTFAANYRKVVDNIRKANPEAKIILCTPRKGYGFGNFLPANCNDQKEGGYYLKDYADLVRAIAEKEGFILADFFATCGDQDDLASLSIDTALHPNDAGYQKMANELVKAILRQFPDAKEIQPGAAAFTDDGTPKSVTFNRFLSSSPQVVLTGVDVTKVTVEAGTLNGTWIPGSPFDASIRFLRRDVAAKKTVCQLQCRGTDKATRSLLVELAQDEEDVTARIVWGRYSWNWPVGTDFDKEGYDGGAGIAMSQSEAGYGIGSITFGINKPDIASATAPEVTEEDTLQDDGTLQAGALTFAGFVQSTIGYVLKDADLSSLEVVSADMGGAWIPGSPYKASVHFVQRDSAKKTMTCQFQILPPDACTRCVCVEFKQVGKNVTAKALWARYVLNGPEPGIDFTKPGIAAAPIAGAQGALGYGISNLVFQKIP